jgi:hypothetical protein
VRDEGGMEPMSHIFSSPEKSPAPSLEKRSRPQAGSNEIDATIISSEAMDIQESVFSL